MSGGTLSSHGQSNGYFQAGDRVQGIQFTSSSDIDCLIGLAHNSNVAGSYQNIAFALYRRLGELKYNEGQDPWESPFGSGLYASTFVVQLRVNANGKVEYVVDGSVMHTSDIDAWSRGDKFWVASGHNAPSFHSFQWVTADGTPVGPVWT